MLFMIVIAANGLIRIEILNPKPSLKTEEKKKTLASDIDFNQTKFPCNQ